MPDFWAILLALAFLALNLGTLGDYGMSFDEPSGMDRGRRTIALLQSMISPDSVDPSETQVISFHPTFYATWNYLVSEFLVRFATWDRIPAWHFLNLITASVGLVILFYLGKTMFNATTGLAAEIFMIFFPRFVAHAHYNAKDIPVMVLGMLTLLLLILALKRGRTKYWVMAALSFAASVTSKLDGLFLLGIFLVPWLISRLGYPSKTRSAEIRRIGLFLYLGLLFIFLFWPALWINPFHLLQGVSHFSGQFNRFDLTYLGQRYPIDQVPWHYMAVHLMAVTPLPSLLFVITGTIGSFQIMSRNRTRFEHWLLGFWILFPLLARMMPGALQYDGMRHVFLVVPALALLAGLGFHRLITQLEKRARVAFSGVAGCGVLLVWLTWQIVQIHPYQGSYLNEGVRLAVPSEKLGNLFDFYSWGTPLKEGADWLNANAPLDSSVSVPNHLPTLESYPLRKDLRFQITNHTDFTILMGWRKDLREGFDTAPIFSARCYGADLLLIYPRPN